MNEINRLASEKLGLPIEKVQSFIPTLLGFLRSHVPESVATKFDAAVGTKPTHTADAGEVIQKAEAAGISIAQVKTLADTVLTFLKDKLPKETYEQLSRKLTEALGGGGLSGLVSKVTGMFSGKS